ncbi:MAG: hypothetical protein ACYDFT_02865 [Thermoplasmata archaeon]
MPIMADGMFPDGIREAPSPADTQSPPEASAPGRAPSPARFSYLVGRLRTRQITIEEATELFEIQQRMIVISSSTPPSPPPTGAPPAAPNTGAPTPSASPPSFLGADALWEALPALAAGAGILAAVLKRAELGPRGPRSAPSAGTPPPKGTDAPPSGR